MHRSTIPAGDCALEGRVAIVTGGAGGLGSAVQRWLSERGATVHGVDIAGEGMFHADLSTPEGNREMVEYVLAESGRIDILVLNAGVQYLSPIEEFPDEEWVRLRSVMLDGPFYALKAAWPALTRRPGGRVVVTSTPLGYAGEPKKIGYVAAKHGVLGVMRVAALEGADYGLTANAVAPGWMDTAMLRGQLAAQAASRGISEEEVIEIFSADQPGNRFIDIEEVAATITFLASPQASGINGVCLPIDLGSSINN